jgi:CheY-like chemotaxis protein
MIPESVISPIESVFQMARILVIDDDEAVRSVLTILLGQKAHQVVTAQDGRRGLTAVESDHFDLLIVDIFMPEMDGFKFLDALKQLGDRGKIDSKIIVLTNSVYADTPRIVNAKSNPMIHSVLLKPLSVEALAVI